jgi:hypothetical protein
MRSVASIQLKMTSTATTVNTTLTLGEGDDMADFLYDKKMEDSLTEPPKEVVRARAR